MNKYMEELTELLQTGLEEYATSHAYRLNYNSGTITTIPYTK